MQRSFASLAGSRKIVAAVLVAVIVFGIQLVQQILSTVLYLGVYLCQDAGTGSNEVAWLVPGLLWTLFTTVLPFALGVFLYLWLLAPIAAELRLMSVVGRSLLGVVGGAVILFVTVLLGSLFTNFDESAGLVFGWAYGAMATAASNIGWVSLNAMYSAGNLAITTAPLTVLAGVLVWLWLRAHPLEAPKTVGAGEV